MSATLLMVLAFVAVALLALFQSVLTALFVQEVKGALADKLRCRVTSAAARIPDPALRATLEAEWFGELGAATDRPLTAVFLVRGYNKAARVIAADLAPVPASDAGPRLFGAVQHASARSSGALTRYVRGFLNALQSVLEQHLGLDTFDRALRPLISGLVGVSAAGAITTAAVSLARSSILLLAAVGLTLLGFISVLFKRYE
jgi:hypothetical protein